MIGRRATDRKITKRYTGEASAMEIRYKILKLILEKKEAAMKQEADDAKEGMKQEADDVEAE